MGRCKNNRHVMAYPRVSGFTPIGTDKANAVSLTLDEYEVIRLLDYMGLQQVEAADVMGISRPTLTRIYMEARRKMATAIVEGRPLDLSAGNPDYQSYLLGKNTIVMKNQIIAIPTCNGILWPHFGKAPEVTIVTVENGVITDTVTLEAPEHEHGAMPRFIAAKGCTDVLCGGLGPGAINMLNQMGIQVHAGAPELPVTELMEKYLGQTIVYGESSCSCHCHGDHHHEHGEHHGEGGCQCHGNHQ